ncbi:MAG TPA: hypothetical protein TECP_00985 [Hyphomicrobiaceae bacterium MAG_BT-2024]
MTTYFTLLYSNLSLSKYSRTFLHKTLLTIVGSLLLIISAKIKIPIEPVAVTLQVFVVLALGFCYGSRLASISVLFYLIQGASGLPVFTNTPEMGLGVAYMLKGSGGYLAGFLFSAFVVGWLYEQLESPKFLHILATSFAGITAIYTPGLVWLSIVYGLNSTTLLFGFWPFIYTDILKMFLITFIVFAFQQLNQQKSINMFNKNL